jgi:streptogramin lyase
MLRSLLVICAGILAAPQMPAANSSIYVPVSYSTITPVNTKTLLPGTVISAGGAYTFVLSADGNTFFTIESRSPGKVVAIDRATGKQLHAYHTKFPISSGLAVLPNGSQIYVGTCPANPFVCQGYVEVFDVASGAHLAAIGMGGDQLSQIVAAPNSATVYAGHYYSCMQPCNGPRVPAPADSVPSDALTAIDVATLRPGASYAYEDFGAMAVAISPDSRHGYVLGQEWYSGVGALYSVDLKTSTVAEIWTGFCGVGSLGVSPNGATLAMALNCQYQLGITFFDASTGAITQTAPSVRGGIISLDAAGHAFVASGGDLDVVNVQTGNVSPVLVGRGLDNAAFSPDMQEMYLLAGAGSAVGALEEGSTKVSKVFGIGGQPTWLAVSPDGGTMYSVGWSGGLWAISTATGDVTAQRLQTVDWIGAMAVSPDGQTLYASALSPNALYFVDAATGVIENSVALPACTANVYGSAMAVSPQGSQLYVVQCGVTAAIDTKTATMVAQIPGTAGYGMAISPKGDVVYVTAGSQVDVVDTATNAVTGAIPIAASSIAFSPDGSKAYAMSGQNNVSGVVVVDTATLAVTGFVPDINPYGGCCYSQGESIAVTADGKFVYAGANPGAVINAKTLAVVGRFEAGGPIVAH